LSRPEYSKNRWGSERYEKAQSTLLHTKNLKKLKASYSIGLIYECLQYFSYIMMASSIGEETGQKGTQILKFHIK
jgi:hypothetical protein